MGNQPGIIYVLCIYVNRLEINERLINTIFYSLHHCLYCSLINVNSPSILNQTSIGNTLRYPTYTKRYRLIVISSS